MSQALDQSNVNLKGTILQYFHLHLGDTLWKRFDSGTILKTLPALFRRRQSGGKYHSLNLRIFEVHNIGIAEGNEGGRGIKRTDAGPIVCDIYGDLGAQNGQRGASLCDVHNFLFYFDLHLDIQQSH